MLRLRRLSQRALALPIAASAVLAATAWGQPGHDIPGDRDQPHQPSERSEPAETRPAADPGLNDASLEDLRSDPANRREPLPPVQPTPPKPPQSALPTVAAPGVDLSKWEVPGRQLYGEGTFLNAVLGRLVQAGSGEWLLTPVAGSNEPVLILLPSQKLQQLEAAAGDVAPERRFVRISGQVFVYRGRHYILPGVFAMAEEPKAETPRSEPAPQSPKSGAGEHGADAAATPAGARSALDEADPDVAALLRELEAERPPRAVEPPPRMPEPAPTADGEAKPVEEAPLAAEGSILVGRRGRVIRSRDDGRLQFVQDNDPDSPATPPMEILPCRLLHNIEALAAQGDGVAVKMSGRVLTYRGRNYLLPSLFQAVRKSDVGPLQ